MISPGIVSFKCRAPPVTDRANGAIEKWPGRPPSRIRVKTGHRDVPAEFLSPLHWSVMIGFVCMEQFDLSTQDVFIRVEKGLRERYPSLSATGEPHWD